jgi:hypothetical protein
MNIQLNSKICLYYFYINLYHPLVVTAHKTHLTTTHRCHIITLKLKGL